MQQIVSLKPASRGMDLGGPSGTVYRIGDDDLLRKKEENGAICSDAWCYDADVIEFLSFPKLFEGGKVIAPAVKKAPPPPPPPKAKKGTKAKIEIEEPAEPEIAVLPMPNATKAVWLKWATDNNVVLDPVEIDALTKEELVSTIRERFANKDD